MTKCERTGCDNAATLLPVLSLTPGWGTPARAEMPLPTCQPCASALTIADLLNDDAWASTVESFRGAGLVVPRRSLTKLTWTDL